MRTASDILGKALKAAALSPILCFLLFNEAVTQSKDQAQLLFKQMLTSTKYQMELQATLVYALLLRIGFQYSS
jgi:hypothetical protein